MANPTFWDTHFSFIPFPTQLFLELKVTRSTGVTPSCYWVNAMWHPGQVAILLQTLESIFSNVYDDPGYGKSTFYWTDTNRYLAIVQRVAVMFFSWPSYKYILNTRAGLIWCRSWISVQYQQKKKKNRISGYNGLHLKQLLRYKSITAFVTFIICLM